VSLFSGRFAAKYKRSGSGGNISRIHQHQFPARDLENFLPSNFKNRLQDHFAEVHIFFVEIIPSHKHSRKNYCVENILSLPINAHILYLHLPYFLHKSG
jgi:hypothetical protein